MNPASGPVPVNPHLATATPVAGPREVWAGWIGAWVLRLLTLTLRIRVEDPAALRDRVQGGPFILLFWHNRILLVPVVWNRFFARHRAQRGMALTSPSRDGELIAQLINRFGIGPVRGSATRRGSTALRELARMLRGGHDIAITPDGSRGPLYEIKPGPVLLAQLTGRPVLPISFEFSRAWRLKSWDRLLDSEAVFHGDVPRRRTAYDPAYHQRGGVRAGAPALRGCPDGAGPRTLTPPKERHPTGTRPSGGTYLRTNPADACQTGF